MEKIDLKKEFKEFYNPPTGKVVAVDVPAFNFLMVDGHGDPNTSQDYRDAIEALYSIAYTLKFMIKKGKIPIDFGVAHLEGLWWADDMNAFVEGKKDLWNWTAMIMQPKYVTDVLFRDAVEAVKKKKNPSALPKVRFENFREGFAAQTMHLGPYYAEKQTIEKVHNFILANGYFLAGKHHEIYISNPQKTAPEKLRTIVRQPMKKH